MGIHHTSYHTGCRKGHLIHTARLFAEDMPPGTHFLDQKDTTAPANPFALPERRPTGGTLELIGPTPIMMSW